MVEKACMAISFLNLINKKLVIVTKGVLYSVVIHVEIHFGEVHPK